MYRRHIHEDVPTRADGRHQIKDAKAMPAMLPFEIDVGHH